MDKLTLKKPIKWGNELVVDLSFREVVARDLRSLKLSEMQFGDLLDLAARLSGHPPSVLDQLSMEDVGTVVDAVGKRLNLGT